MSIREIFRATRIVFGITVDEFKTGESKEAINARGVYCYLTSILNTSQSAAAKDIGLEKWIYEHYVLIYRDKIAFDLELRHKAESIKYLLPSVNQVHFIDEPIVMKDSIRVRIGNSEYKALDMSSQFGKSYMGFINDDYVLTGESLEDAFLSLIHNEIVKCIGRMTMEQLRESLKI